LPTDQPTDMPYKIIIIDDDPVTLTMLSKLLTAADVQVLSARDGRDGLDLAMKERPNLVICDLLIPHIDGLDLCRTIKAEPSLFLTKVILMSAVYKGFHHKSDIYDSGADDFITKPLDTKLLKEKIAQFIKWSGAALDS
jgi:DNA-binding response OmpR family regulator